MRLLDLEKLDVKDQLAVGGDAGESLGAVGEVGGDGQATLAANGHADDANVPALDDLAAAGLEGERLALLVGCEMLALLNRLEIFGGNVPSNCLPFWSLPM